MNTPKKENSAHSFTSPIEFADALLSDYEMSTFDNGDLCWVLCGTTQKYSTEQIYKILGDKEVQPSVTEESQEVIISYEALENEWQKSSSAVGLTFEEWLIRDFTIIRKPKTK